MLRDCWLFAPPANRSGNNSTPGDAAKFDGFIAGFHAGYYPSMSCNCRKQAIARFDHR
jgi:hypothetical protein